MIQTLRIALDVIIQRRSDDQYFFRAFRIQIGKVEKPVFAKREIF